MLPIPNYQNYFIDETEVLPRIWSKRRAGCRGVLIEKKLNLKSYLIWYGRHIIQQKMLIIKLLDTQTVIKRMTDMTIYMRRSDGYEIVVGM